MTSYLPVGYRADRGSSDKRKSKGASKKQVSSRYQPSNLMEWGSQLRDSHLQKRVTTMGGKLVKPISRRVSTSMPNGTNWEDVQNTAEAATKRRVQQQQDHNAFHRGGI